MSEQFGVSEKTISRTMKELENKGLIQRNTKNVQKGKERHIAVLAKDKMSVVKTQKSTKDKMSVAEETNCPLRNGQNDSIKDKLKDKEKDNRVVDN